MCTLRGWLWLRDTRDDDRGATDDAFTDDKADVDAFTDEAATDVATTDDDAATDDDNAADTTDDEGEEGASSDPEPLSADPQSSYELAAAPPVPCTLHPAADPQPSHELAAPASMDGWAPDGRRYDGRYDGQCAKTCISK